MSGPARENQEWVSFTGRVYDETEAEYFLEATTESGGKMAVGKSDCRVYDDGRIEVRDNANVKMIEFPKIQACPLPERKPPGGLKR